MRVSRRAATVSATAAVLVVVLAAVAAAGVASGAAASAPATDSTVTRITVAENGTATWEVQVRTRLTSDADVADYERFQAEFRENTSAYLDTFRQSMRGVVADAAAETGRPMRARDFQARTSIQPAPRRWGIVTYEFEWTSFAARDGEAVVVGDVFDGQFYLTRNDTLEVAAPAGYTAAAVEPDPVGTDDERVRWTGRRTFADDRPFVRFEPQPTPTPTPSPTATPVRATPTPTGTAGGPGTGPTATPGGDDAGTPPPGSDGGTATTVPGSSATSSRGVPYLALLVVPLVLVALAAYRYRTASGGAGPSDRPETGAQAVGTGDTDDAGDGGAAAGTAAGSATDGTASGGTGGPESGGTGEAGADGAEGGTGTADADGTDGDSAVGPTPPLTDAEQVEELLADNDGQLYQSDIVEALDWSKSKGSRVLSDMAEDGAVEKLRIGRQNVIRLAEDDGDDS